MPVIERRSLSVSLTPELHAFIGELVKGGAYGNSSEVVRAGLRLLRQDETAGRAAPRRVAATPKEPTGSNT